MNAGPDAQTRTPEHDGADQPVPAGRLDGLDKLLLDPSRLGIMALLSDAEWAEFGFVRDTLAMTDSALSKQITTLGKAGYVEVRKGYVGKRPRTWLNLSRAGRSALRAHVTTLRRIADNVDDAAQG